MLVGVAGGEAHEEDTWIGREVSIGEAIVRMHEQVARCAITTKNPDTGERDLDTLRVIRAYRGIRGTKALDFGVYGEVVAPGAVRVGDRAEPPRLNARALPAPLARRLPQQLLAGRALSTDVRAAYEEYLESWEELGSPWDLWVEKTEEVRAAFARLIGASRRTSPSRRRSRPR